MQFDVRRAQSREQRAVRGRGQAGAVGHQHEARNAGGRVLRQPVVHREQHLDPAGAAADHGDAPDAPRDRIGTNPIPAREERVDRLHAGRVLARAGEAHVRRGPHVQRDDVEGDPLPGRGRRRAGVGVERRDPVANEARARVRRQRPEVDVGFRVGIMARHEPGQHARVGREAVGRHQNERDTGRRSLAESAQHLDVRVPAAREQDRARRHAGASLQCSAVTDIEAFPVREGAFWKAGRDSRGRRRIAARRPAQYSRRVAQGRKAGTTPPGASASPTPRRSTWPSRFR